VTRYYSLRVETGATVDDAGRPVSWVACPALPGAYEEAASADAARERLAALARHINAEHGVRDDPPDPEIAVGDRPPPARDGLLVVPISDADVEEARNAPLLMIEQPEP
jgi:hypothetical protein